MAVPHGKFQRSQSVTLAPPQNPRGSKVGAPLIVDANPLTPQTPVSPGDIDLDDEKFTGKLL